MPTEPTHARTRRRMSNTARALTVAGVLVAVLAGAAVGGVAWFQHRLANNIESLGDPFQDLPDRPSPAPSDPAEPNQAMNILVLGSDSRISAGDPSQWQAGAQRTDAIMLVHIPASREAAQVISIPRDSWVEIPGHGENKINAAFSFGGPALTIQTVEQLTGVHIDHFVVTDFTSFVGLTDALGGVQIRIPEDIGDGKQVFFEAGVHQMTGEQALKYVRQRHGLVNGDFGRVQRQQNWVRAIMGKVNNNRSDVVMMARFMNAVSQSVAADDGFTMDVMQGLMDSSRHLATNDVTFMTAPNSGTGRSAGGQSIVVLDRAKFDPLMAAIANDTATEFVEQNRDSLTILPATVR